MASISPPRVRTKLSFELETKSHLVGDAVVVDEAIIVTGSADRVCEYQISIAGSPQQWASAMRRDGFTGDEIDQARKELQQLKAALCNRAMAE